MTTRMTSTHFTSTIAWRFTTLTSTSTECTHARIVSRSLIIHTHIWLKFEPCPHLIHMSSMWALSLWLDLLHSLLPSLPPQRRAGAGAQQEDHGKPVRLRYQRRWGHLRRPLPPHKGGERTSIHKNAEPAIAELLLRIIICVNQLSVCGAVADWCQELAQRIEDHCSCSTGNLVAKNDSESQVASADVSNFEWLKLATTLFSQEMAVLDNSL